MTELIYQRNSYLRKFEATVSAVDNEKHAVLLDRTAFYPGGGGQPHDTGVLLWNDNSLPMLRARKGAEGIWHEIDPAFPLPEQGAPVDGELDWDRRYQLMRTHTAMHILCGVVFRDYQAQVTGGDMEPLLGRMDFEFENLSRDLVGVIEATVNKEVQANHPVRVQILSREKAFAIPDLIRTKINLLPPQIQEVRVVELVGLDLQADGGTHVKATGEVGALKIVDYKSKGKINKRIYLQLES
ncbi:MAG: alanyl-tRNA editing protein [Anaerolineae bacterium]|nr:alanyl-tRNA editing protein [Anaerolineae bacterium]